MNDSLFRSIGGFRDHTNLVCRYITDSHTAQALVIILYKCFSRLFAFPVQFDFYIFYQLLGYTVSLLCLT